MRSSYVGANVMVSDGEYRRPPDALAISPTFFSHPFQSILTVVIPRNSASACITFARLMAYTGASDCPAAFTASLNVALLKVSTPDEIRTVALRVATGRMRLIAQI